MPKSQGKISQQAIFMKEWSDKELLLTRTNEPFALFHSSVSCFLNRPDWSHFTYILTRTTLTGYRPRKGCWCKNKDHNIPFTGKPNPNWSIHRNQITTTHCFLSEEEREGKAFMIFSKLSLPLTMPHSHLGPENYSSEKIYINSTLSSSVSRYRSILNNSFYPCSFRESVFYSRTRSDHDSFWGFRENQHTVPFLFTYNFAHLFVSQSLLIWVSGFVDQ